MEHKQNPSMGTTSFLTQEGALRPELNTPEMKKRLEELQSKLKVSTVVHPEDHMFAFQFKLRPNGEGADLYFHSGRGDAMQISNTIKQLLPKMARPKVLEFASGFGRVSRHMLRVMPDIDFRISDIHAPAVIFASDFFGLQGFKSEPLPDQVVIDGHYDFIFALSFFSHIPDSIFLDWMLFLYSALKEGGFLLFTTHGESSMKKFKHLAQQYDPEAGFGYARRSEQPDLDYESYGSMCVDFDYVVRKIRKMPAQIIRFRAAGWWGHQDEWIIHKPCDMESSIPV